MNGNPPGPEAFAAAVACLRAMVHSIDTPACLVSPAGQILDRNRAANELWRGDPGRWSGFIEVFREDGCAINKDQLPVARASRGEETGSTRLLGRRPDGALVRYTSCPSPVRNAAGDVGAVLELMWQAIPPAIPRDFLHQVSNSVGVILGNTDLALMELPEEHTASELLQEVRDAAARLKDLLVMMRGNEDEQKLPPRSPMTNVKIACVDDDEAFLTLSSRAMRKLGHEMVEFSNADSAWKTISASPGAFDLVIVDKGLAGEDGLQVASEWLRKIPQLPLCLTSGYVDEAFEAAARNAGVTCVLRKPNTMDEFAASIQRLLETFTRR